MGLPAYAAKKKAVKTDIQSWQLPSSAGLADTVAVDSSLLNMALRDIQYDYSINNAYNANTISPIQSRLYFQRKKGVEDLFSNTLSPYIIRPQDVQFYRTNVPYSKVGYSRGFTTDHDENEINFLFTGNITRQWNLGLKMDYLYSPGHFTSQDAQAFRGALFSSLNTTHYSAHAALTWTNLSAFDNGGIKDPTDVASPLKPEDYPTRRKGMARLKYISGYLNHYYSITTTRNRRDSILSTNEWGEKVIKDTVYTKEIPTLSFRHIFETNNSMHRYVEQSPRQLEDSTNVLTLRNTLSVVFEEAFTGKANIGAAAFVYHEGQRYLDSVQWSDTTAYAPWGHSLFVGGTVYRRGGKYIHFDAEGEVCLVGAKLGQFNVHGKLSTDVPIRKDSMHIEAKAYVQSHMPTYYQQHFHGIAHRWDNAFAHEYKYGVGGEISYPTRYVMPRLRVNFEDVQNHIYFDHNGNIAQHSGHIQVLSADLQLNIRTPWICLDNTVVVQKSTSEVLPLPLLSLYHNLYYHGWWAKRAMEAHIGVDFRYFTSYYSPVLDASTGAFCIQDPNGDRVKIGNYPILDVYANFYVKLIHLKFFVAYTHFNHLFMRQNMNQFIMPNYPVNPDVLRAGLAFHFYK